MANITRKKYEGTNKDKDKETLIVNKSEKIIGEPIRIRKHN